MKSWSKKYWVLPFLVILISLLTASFAFSGAWEKFFKGNVLFKARIEQKVTSAKGEAIKSKHNIESWTGLGNQVQGIYVDARAKSANVDGTVRGAELKAVNDSDGSVSIIQGATVNADTKGGSTTTTMRGQEIVVDMGATAVVTDLIGLRIAAILNAAPGGNFYGIELNLEGSGTMTDICLQNDETITNAVDGTVTISGITDIRSKANTDGQLFIPPSACVGKGVSGTWTLTDGTNLCYLRRTANADAQKFFVPVIMPNRTAADRGYEITSIKMFYDVSTADLDDVTLVINRYACPADGSAMEAVAITSTYDEAHDTASERGDDTANPEHHTLIKTITTPAYVTNKGYELEITVDGDVGVAGVFDLYGFEVIYTETLL